MGSLFGGGKPKPTKIDPQPAILESLRKTPKVGTGDTKRRTKRSFFKLPTAGDSEAKTGLKYE